MLAPHLEPVDLPLRCVLERPNVPIEHVYFLTSGVASIVASSGRDKRAEVGLIGLEGMSGTAIVMGNGKSPFECVMQIRGAGVRIGDDRLRDAMNQSATLRGKCLRYANSLSTQTAHTVVANAQAFLEERLCRWLLMCHDRVEGDSLALTHDFMATMLGVRRAGVTLAIHTLEGRGLIRATRGCVMIADREGLEDGANGIYGMPEAEYERIVGVSPDEWTTNPIVQQKTQRH